VQKDPENRGNPGGIVPDLKPTVEAQPPPESKTEQFHDNTQQKEEIMQQSQDQVTVEDQRLPNQGDADPEVDAKTRSNRENAQKSTGPRTNTGRAASSKNAVKHGLFAADITKYFAPRRNQNATSASSMALSRISLQSETWKASWPVAPSTSSSGSRPCAPLNKVYAGGGLLKDTMEELLERSKKVIGLASLYDSRFQRASKTMEGSEPRAKVPPGQGVARPRAAEGHRSGAHTSNTTFDPADLVFNQAHLTNAKKLAQFCAGEGRVEKKVVDYVAQVPPKAA
jgi:hypothetical protein